MKKYYSFAGIELEIDIPDQWMYEDDGHLAGFCVESVNDPYVFYFGIADAFLPPKGVCIANTGALRAYGDGTRYIGSVEQSWENAYAQILCDGRQRRALLKHSSFPNRIGAKTVLNCMAAEHLIAENGGFILHSSFIAHNGRAILFTAPSGTGKSTQADLWQQLRDAKICNGDRCAVRCTEDGRFACGIPFAGSSEYCENVTLPLAAVVYLKQAPQTEIRRLRGAEAFRRIWEGVSVNTWDREDVALVSDTVTKVLSQVPVFELACTPDESAILALEGALTT